ncbi:HTH-type transcriptional regulator BhcR [Spiribacter pallidus]|uniref:HTH-type transcriptional repressor AllR n=1 Tax=Spiribacter pallidus TaxID=1987936 RepID=A0ABV3TFA6_9GAMM
MNFPTQVTRPHRRRGRPRTGTPETSGSINQALDRGLIILEHLATGDAQTLSDLAVDAGLSTSTVYRLLVTLARRGLVEFDEPTQTWSIGVEAFRIGSAFRRRTNVIEAARPIMRALMTQTGETCNLGIAEGDVVIFVSQVETHHPIRAFFRPGTRTPLHASGIGKALLAQTHRGRYQDWAAQNPRERFTAHTLTDPAALATALEQTQQRGWALDDEESTAGMRCLAAAVFDEYGEAVAGISISGPLARLSDAALPGLSDQVRGAAAALTEAIGGRRP